MARSLPPRPNLDHLRRRAKSLLADLEAGNRDAAATILEHLPAAKGMTTDQVFTARFRLADAQSAVARQTGFASWPQLARHVEQLRSLEGTWEFESLEIDGSPLPPAAVSSSRLLIDGDRFRTESPEAVYEGVFNINVETDPHGIDIEFIAGPEAGNWNYGIFRVDQDRFSLCLDVTGKGRPSAFRSSPGSGYAMETLRRTSRTRPEAVTGGTPPPPRPMAPAGVRDGFEFVPSPTLARLQGEWTAERVVRDGKELPQSMLATGCRSATDNEVKISFGGQVMIHALVRIDERTDPIQVDYFNLSGAAKGLIQHGLMQWQDQIVCFCMAAPGQPRPAELSCPVGSGRTLSYWRPRK